MGGTNSRPSNFKTIHVFKNNNVVIVNNLKAEQDLIGASTGDLRYTKLKSLEIKPGFEYLNKEIFSNILLIYAKNLYLPDSIETIGDNTFSHFDKDNINLYLSPKSLLIKKNSIKFGKNQSVGGKNVNVISMVPNAELLKNQTKN